MKRQITFILLVGALFLQGCSYRVFRDAEAANPTASAPQTPTAEITTSTPEPGLSEEEIRNRVLVGYRDQQKTYPNEAGGALLHFACRTPQVSLPGLETQENAINTALISLTESYIAGSDVEGDVDPGVEKLLEEAAYAYGELSPESWVPFAKERTVFVSRGDAALLSFVYDNYTNMAGAHGMTTRVGVNFDVEAGRELLFADLAADEEALRNHCLQTMKEKAAEMAGLFEDYASTLPQLIRDGNWYFSNSGLVIVANPYDIAPYAAGRIEFTIGYKSLSGILHERWQRPAREIVQGGIDGSLGREQTLGDSESLADLRLTEQGEEVILWANNSVYDVRVNEVIHREESGEFAADTEYFYVSRMDDGEFLRLLVSISEEIPKLSVSWRLPEGTLQRLLLSQNAADGSLLLVDPASMDTMPPLKLQPGDSVWRDLDRDDLGESIEFKASEKGCELSIACNGELISRSFDYVEEQVLWIANADGNSDMDLLVSGKKADGSYETRVFRLRGELIPLPFLDGDDELESLPMRLVSAENGCFLLEGRVDALGTYTGQRSYTAGPQGGLTPDPESGWELADNESWLKTAKDLTVTLPDGSESRLSSGTEIRLTHIYAEKALYETRDGSTGAFGLYYDDGSKTWVAAGIKATEAFVGLPK